MSRLSKLTVRTLVQAVPAQPARDAIVTCPIAPPGTRYIVVNGRYQLVPASGGAAPPPNTGGPTRQVCVLVPSPAFGAGGARLICGG